MLLKLLALQTLKRNLKQFRNSKINYKRFINTLACILPLSRLVFKLNFESRVLLNILRCRFAFHFGGLYMQGRFFAKMSEESVIDFGDRLQGGIIVRKTI